MVNEAQKAHYFAQEIVWNTEQDAVGANINYSCIICNASMSFSIEKDGLGTEFRLADDDLNRYIADLEEKYHAKAWCAEKLCPNNHKQELIYIFGETQPARYVLTKAAVLS